MQEYLIWVIPFLLAIYSIRAFIRDSKKMKTPTCAFCGSTNINANMFKKYGSCKDCGHKWKILKLGSAGDGGGEDKYGYVGFEQAIKKGHMPL